MFYHVTKYTVMCIHKGANQNTEILTLFFADFTACPFNISNKCFAMCFGLISSDFVLES